MLEQAAFFEDLWDGYKKINPQAGRIHALLEGRGERVVNDHIAFRTFNHKAVSIQTLQPLLEELGYTAQGEYTFTQKKLYAKHYEAANLPKVFLSELRLELCSKQLRSAIQPLMKAIKPSTTRSLSFFNSGRHWPQISWANYSALKKESEYAAWLAVFGFRANHFTVLVNELKTFNGLLDLNSFLKANGFTLNSQGGEIKGGPQEKLEQSSTLAAPVSTNFSDVTKVIPGCYYEFAFRYPAEGKKGGLFQGFVTDSADKIFESTDNLAAKANKKEK